MPNLSDHQSPGPTKYYSKSSTGSAVTMADQSIHRGPQEHAPVDNVYYHITGPSDSGSSLRDNDELNNQYAEASWEGGVAKNPHVQVRLLTIIAVSLVTYTRRTGILTVYLGVTISNPNVLHHAGSCAL